MPGAQVAFHILVAIIVDAVHMSTDDDLARNIASKQAGGEPRTNLNGVAAEASKQARDVEHKVATSEFPSKTYSHLGFAKLVPTGNDTHVLGENQGWTKLMKVDLRYNKALGEAKQKVNTAKLKFDRLSNCIVDSVIKSRKVSNHTNEELAVAELEMQRARCQVHEVLSQMKLAKVETEAAQEYELVASHVPGVQKSQAAAEVEAMMKRLSPVEKNFDPGVQKSQAAAKVEAMKKRVSTVKKNFEASGENGILPDAPNHFPDGENLSLPDPNGLSLPDPNGSSVPSGKGFMETVFPVTFILELGHYVLIATFSGTFLLVGIIVGVQCCRPKPSPAQCCQRRLLAQKG